MSRLARYALMALAFTVSLPASAAEPLKLTRESPPTNSAAASADGRLYAIGGPGAMVFDATGKELATLKDKVWRLAFSPDGKFLIGGGSGEDTTTRIYDTATFKPVLTIPDTREAVALSGDSSRLITLTQSSAEKEPSVAVYELATGKQLAKFPIKDPSVDYFALSRDGDRAAAILPSSQVLKVWDVASKAELLSVRLPDPWGPVAFSGDGKQVVVTGISLSAWHLASKAPVKFASPDATSQTSPSGLLFPDGKTVAKSSSTGDGIVLYELPSGRVVRRWQTATRVNVAMAVSPDGKTLAVLGSDFPPGSPGKIQLFNVLTGKPTGEIATLKLQQAMLFLSKDAAGVCGYYHTRGIWLYPLGK